ncbi:MAG: outer membrane protein OmpA-like peptidoglycan-associated protein [Verrucomicrobiales bacterium]|jgi:outer membrane protein OmpA-like peptidoglycan-associated protein
MSANSNYTWESTNSSFSSSDPNRKLKGWLVIAAGVSFLAHAGLWVWFTQTTLPETSRTMVEMMDKTQTFKIERVTLNDVVLQEDKSRDDAEMAEILNTDAAPLVKEINEDDPNIYDKLPEHQIRLTSEVEDMSKFLASERPSIKGENNDLTKTLAPEDIFSNEELEDAIETMQNRIKLPDRISKEQLPIELEDDGPGLLAGNDLEAMNLAMAKAAGNANLTKGFSNLDDLLNRTGPLLDDTKPILIPTDLLFQFNQSDLQEAARLSMMKLGLLIKRNQESKFVIEGHTDTLGSDEYNMALSLKRAQSVQSWLVESLGLGSDRVDVKGFGETKPLVPTGDRDAQAINRRVEIAIRPVGT